MSPLIKRQRNVALAGAVVLVVEIAAGVRSALAQPVENRPWSEMVIVVGHEVSLSLPDGYVEGKALGVTQNALQLDVRKTSNEDLYAEGPTTIARSLITVVRMRRGDNRAPRVASQTLGQAAVFGGLAGLGARNGLRGGLRNVGVQLGAAAAGVALGRKLDNRTVETVIRIVPEPGNAKSNE